jgi:excisionase family DNA binding protein
VADRALALVAPAAGETLHTPDDVARHLQVSRSLIYALIKRGDLRAIYIGRLPRIPASSLAQYLAAAAERGA